eukprot:scaffold7068_cov301-Pinguiococcus_pyrenoidosus.AAC.1
MATMTDPRTPPFSRTGTLLAGTPGRNAMSLYRAVAHAQRQNTTPPHSSANTSVRMRARRPAPGCKSRKARPSDPIACAAERRPHTKGSRSCSIPCTGSKFGGLRQASRAAESDGKPHLAGPRKQIEVIHDGHYIDHQTDGDVVLQNRLVYREHEMKRRRSVALRAAGALLQSEEAKQRQKVEERAQRRERVRSADGEMEQIVQAAATHPLYSLPPRARHGVTTLHTLQRRTFKREWPAAPNPPTRSFQNAELGRIESQLFTIQAILFDWW